MSKLQSLLHNVTGEKSIVKATAVPTYIDFELRISNNGFILCNFKLNIS